MTTVLLLLLIEDDGVIVKRSPIIALTTASSTRCSLVSGVKSDREAAVVIAVADRALVGFPGQIHASAAHGLDASYLKRSCDATRK